MSNSVEGIDNIGATCWLNALVQCFRTCPNGKELEHKTRNLLLEKFGNVPSDAQEALMYIIEELKLTDFIGEETQTVVFPGGKSIRKDECTVWFHNKGRSEVISDYVDEHGKKHNVAIIQRELTKVPKILVSDTVSHKGFYEKKLQGLVCWGWGHYVAYVKSKDVSLSKGDPLSNSSELSNSIELSNWYFANDNHIRITDTVPSSAYLAFYHNGVGETDTP